MDKIEDVYFIEFRFTIEFLDDLHIDSVKREQETKKWYE